MKYYVQYEEKRNYSWNNSTKNIEEVPEYFVDCLGSSSIFILDGRTKLETMISDAKHQANRLLIKPDAFKIMQGNLKRSHCVYREEL